VPVDDRTAQIDAPGAAPTDAERSPREVRRAAQRQGRLERLERKQLHRAERAARGPGAWRTWVLPVLKLLVAAAIAIALVKLAFFPSAEPATADEAFPGAVFEEPLAAVERGSIENAEVLRRLHGPGLRCDVDALVDEQREVREHAGCRRGDVEDA
jgi:hypothetical protein